MVRLSVIFCWLSMVSVHAMHHDQDLGAFDAAYSEGSGAPYGAGKLQEDVGSGVDAGDEKERDMSIAGEAVDAHAGRPVDNKFWFRRVMGALYSYSPEGISRIEKALEHIENINEPNRLGDTMLLRAARYGHPYYLQLLIARKAEVNQAHAKTGDLPLFTAIRCDHDKTVQVLLEAKAKVNVVRSSGEHLSPLITAAARGNTVIAEKLLNARASIDLASAQKGGVTPLIAALFKGHTPMVRLLLDAKADTSKCDSKGRSPLQYAVNKKNKEAEELLRDALQQKAAA